MQHVIDYRHDRALTEKYIAREISWNGIHSENNLGTDWPIRNKDNDYLVNRELQASGKSWTEIEGLGTQDNSMQETIGPIADRTIQRLGLSETAIISLRKLSMEANKVLPAWGSVTKIDSLPALACSPVVGFLTVLKPSPTGL